MSDVLHRLVSHARGAPEAATRRIVPLLAPRFPARADKLDSETPRELSLDPGRSVKATVHTPDIAKHPSRTPARDQTRAADDIHRAPSREPAPHPASDDRIPQTAAQPIGGQPSTDVQVEHTHESPSEVHAVQSVTATAAPSFDQSSPTPSRASEALPYGSPHATAPLAAVEEHTQTISISIGRVEVRNAASPSPATSQRPAFKPSVSLDAFLGRDRSGGR